MAKYFITLLLPLLVTPYSNIDVPAINESKTDLIYYLLLDVII